MTQWPPEESLDNTLNAETSLDQLAYKPKPKKKVKKKKVKKQKVPEPAGLLSDLPLMKPLEVPDTDNTNIFKLQTAGA